MLKRLIITLTLVFSLAACDLDQIDKYTSAVREDTATSPVDVREYVNGLPYAFTVAEPALEAFRAVAADRGWASEDIESWVPFITDVMANESGFCWNVKGGAKMANVGCEIRKQGRGSDSGFGQLISLHYKPGRWLCEQEGLCSSAAIIDNPYDSMTALVALVERSGGQPWCYNAKARRYHKCSLVP